MMWIAEVQLFGRLVDVGEGHDDQSPQKGLILDADTGSTVSHEHGLVGGHEGEVVLPHEATVDHALPRN